MLPLPLFNILPEMLYSFLIFFPSHQEFCLGCQEKTSHTVYIFGEAEKWICFDKEVHLKC